MVQVFLSTNEIKYSIVNNQRMPATRIFDALTVKVIRIGNKLYGAIRVDTSSQPIIDRLTFENSFRETDPTSFLISPY